MSPPPRLSGLLVFTMLDEAEISSALLTIEAISTLQVTGAPTECQPQRELRIGASA
jgi:hypothetical protein